MSKDPTEKHEAIAVYASFLSPVPFCSRPVLVNIHRNGHTHTLSCVHTHLHIVLHTCSTTSHTHAHTQWYIHHRCTHTVYTTPPYSSIHSKLPLHTHSCTPWTECKQEQTVANQFQAHFVREAGYHLWQTPLDRLGLGKHPSVCIK